MALVRCLCTVLLLYAVAPRVSSQGMGTMDMSAMDMDDMDHGAMDMAGAPSPSAALDALMHATDDAMMAVTPCSSVDIYFAQMMIAHHRGAISMAEWYLQHGSNPTLVNVSNDIVAEQTREIAQLQTILGTLPIPADCGSAPSQAVEGLGVMHDGSMVPAQAPGIAELEMSMGDMMAPAPAMLVDNADVAFASEMRTHHQAAIDMANVEIQYGSNADLIALAREIVASQTAQIETFNMVLADSAGVTETAG